MVGNLLAAAINLASALLNIAVFLETHRAPPILCATFSLCLVLFFTVAAAVRYAQEDQQ